MDEHGMTDVSYPVVRAYVAERKPQIRAEAGRGPAEAFVPQSHRPGDEAEVDFGEVVVRLAGEEVKCFLFCLRLSFSGKAVHRVSLSGEQEAFFEGHEHAFRILGGVPSGKIRYDNLKAAVAQVIGFSRSRVEADRWTAFRSHWARMLSTASWASPAPTRKAASRGRSAGSAVTTSSRFPTCRHRPGRRVRDRVLRQHVARPAQDRSFGRARLGHLPYRYWTVAHAPHIRSRA
jgi:hypothetical protein